MEFSKARIGQRVIVPSKWCGRTEFAGQKGTIVTKSHADSPVAIGVEFDDPISSFLPGTPGHDCGGNAQPGHGLYGRAKDIDLLPEVQIEDVKILFDDVLGGKNHEV